MQNRCARLGAERLHKTLEQNLRSRVASAFLSWVNAGLKPGVAQTQHASRSPALARAEDFGTPRGPKTGGVADGPPPTVVSETREAATNTPAVAEEGESAEGAPTPPPPPSVPSDVDVREDGREDATPETGGNAENDSPVLSAPLPGGRVGLNQQSHNPWSDRAVGASTASITERREKVDNRDRDHVGGGFPFPVISSSPACVTTPSAVAASHRPAPGTAEDGNNAIFCNSTGGEAPGPFARLDGSGGPSANPDAPRVMLALRAAVGNELYGVGERLLRCVEADHREIQGKAYRPIPVTGAEREQFHACLRDATRGPLRRAVLRFLRVQESYRAVAVEREREGAECSREGRRVGHGLGVGGVGVGGDGVGVGGGSVRDTRRRSKDTRRVKEHRYDVSSLATGPLSSPAEKARAARYDSKQRQGDLFHLLLPKRG